MNLETLAQLGEFAGGIGVILSLIYLAVQVRGNTRSQQADITARVLNRMRGVEADRSELPHLYETGHVGDEIVVAEASAAIGHEDVVTAIVL